MKLKRILSLVLILIMIMPLTVMAVPIDESQVTAPIAVLMDGKTRKSFIR